MIGKNFRGREAGGISATKDTKLAKEEGRGRDIYLEKQENRFADRNALGGRMGGDNLDNSGQLFQGAPPERAAAGK